MTTFQKVIKHLAMAFAIFLVVSIIGGILSVVGLFGGFFDSDVVMDDVKTYEVSSNITALDIQINAADFTIKQAEAFSVESNLKHLTVQEKDGTLLLSETKKFSRAYNGAGLTLYIPTDTVFEKAEITTGAGRLNIDTLSADTVHFELGAGEVAIDTLTAALSVDIDGGAGKITISDGSLNNLDLAMGVGQLNLASAITGKSELDLGVGESNITLIGNKDDYSLDIEKGLGSITVDGENISNVKGFGSGQNRIDVDGGIGAIHVKFKEVHEK